MKRQIFIYLHLQRQDDVPNQVSWLVHESGHPTGPVFHGDLQTAANHAMGCRVIVLVPAEMMLLTHVELPAMNKQRLLKAIPYALEEQVAGDVDGLHFCPGPRDQNDNQACVVVGSKLVTYWLDTFKEVNIHADVITSELYCLPADIDTWTLLFNTQGHETGSKALLRLSSFEGLSIDMANVVPLVGSFLDNCSEEKLPKHLRIITSDSVSISEANEHDSKIQEAASSTIAETIEHLRDVCDKKQIVIEQHETEDEMLLTLMQHFNEADSINILQGEFSRKEQLEKMLRPWIASAAVLFAWFALQIGLMIVEYSNLSQTDERLRAEIVSVYKDAFPDAKNIIDPKLQMQRGLDELQGSGKGGSDLFSLLSKAGIILKDTQTMSVRGVRYKTNKLDLDIEIADLQSLDELKLRLVNEAGLQVEIVSASSKGGKVDGRLQITAT